MLLFKKKSTEIAYCETETPKLVCLYGLCSSKRPAGVVALLYPVGLNLLLFVLYLCLHLFKNLPYMY